MLHLCQLLLISKTNKQTKRLIHCHLMVYRTTVFAI